MLTLNAAKLWLACLIFFLIYVFDVWSYVVGGYYGLSVPVGFLGILMSFLLLMLLLIEKRGGMAKYVFVISLWAPILAAYGSGRFAYADVYFWMRASALFAFGYYFFGFIKNVGFGFFGLMALRLFFLGSGALLLFFFVGDARSGRAEDASNYLRVADALMLSSFLLVVYSESKMSAIIQFCFSCVFLYFAGSRFGLVVFFLSTGLLFFLVWGVKTKFLMVFLAPFAIFVGYHFASSLFEGLSSVHDNRFLRLLFSSDQDTSLLGRSMMMNRAVEVFSDNYFWGDYRYYSDQGVEGHYAHNFMSFWAEMGILGIVLTLMIFYVGIKSISASWKYLRDSEVHKLTFLIAITLLLGIVLAKSYYWNVMYFLVGFLFGFVKWNAKATFQLSKVRRAPLRYIMSDSPTEMALNK